MRPISMSVKNFASYKEEIFDFSQTADLFAIIGQNGGGKSTFFVDTLTTVLFNRARGTNTQGTGLENLITLGEDFLEVNFVFEVDGAVINVIRKRFAKGGQELELFIDGVSHTDKIKETQAKLESIIKIDYDTFMDTVIIGQGNSGSFMKKAPNERKEVFTQVLGLDKYDVIQSYTKEMRKEVKDEIKKLEEDQDELGDSVRYKDQYNDEVDEGQKEIRRLSNEITIKESTLEEELSQKAQYEQKVKEINDILTKRVNLENKVKTISDSINKGNSLKESLKLVILNKDDVNSQLENLTSSLEDYQSRFTELNSSKSSLEATNNMLIQQAKEVKAKYIKLKEFNEAECGFCGQEITESHKEKHLNTWQLEGKQYLSKINGNKQEIENISLEIDELKRSIAVTKSSISSLQVQKNEILQAETKLSSISTRLQELESDLEEKQQEYNENLLIEVENVEEKSFQDNQIKIELNALRQQQTQWQTKVAVAKNELSKIEKNESKVVQIEKEIKDLKEQYALLDELVVGFGKEGIQAIIIDNALPDIEDEINEFLELLTQGQVSIKFVTQKEKGKGKKVSSIETLDIVINDENGSRTYETYSGGEKFRVDFSCHVGLAKYLAKRAGSAIQFFIVDEGVGSQDQVAKDQFIKAVNKLTTIFEKVMVITHIEDIIESFHDKVEVYKDPVLGSKLRIVN